MELREYQEEIAVKIDELFDEKEKRFVGVKLPTGGGKSFLFLDQFDKLIELHDIDNILQNEAGKSKNIFENPDACISTASVRYYAPLNGILEQTQLRVAEYILIDRYISLFKEKYGIEKISSQELENAVNEIGKRMIASSKIKEKNKQSILEKINEIFSKKIDVSKSPEEVLKETLEASLNIFLDNIDKLVSIEFPNLEFVCYQKKDGEIIDIEDEEEVAELIVFDEAHRNKFEDEKEKNNDVKEDESEKVKLSWGERAKELIKKYKNTKFLAITATPERDVDGVDPMLEFAEAAGYSARELRQKEYLASDMNLVSALEEGRVVKPEVVSFDCMLDTTGEYEEIEEILLKLMKNPKKTSDLRRRKDKQTGEIALQDEYHIILVNFLKMCKLSGKLDFVQENLDDKEIIIALEKFKNNDYINEGIEYYKKLEKVVKLISEIDKARKQPDSKDIDEESLELSKKYEELRNIKVSQSISSYLDSREYLRHGKHICFTPTSNSKAKTPLIMQEYKEKMQNFLGLNQDNVMITHSNSKVISTSDDKKNLARFTLDREPDDDSIVMVAMDKFNEGLHVDGVVSLFMNRQFIDRSVNSPEAEKDDPRILFLQQIGRGMHSVTPSNIDTEPTVIFDLACNFMRYNEKLNNIFKISEAQTEFKSLYEECKVVQKNKGKESQEDEVPKVRILDRILSMMQVLTENGIDFSNITRQTRWGDIEKLIPNEQKGNVLDELFMVFKREIKPEYPIGSRIFGAREAFWHVERENTKASQGTKKLYNSYTDKYFSEISFDKLFKCGFFKDLENDKTRDEVDKDGFIIGDCAGIENCFGYNIYTGTKYCRSNPEQGKLAFDVRRFTPKGINTTTMIRFDEHFFRFNKKTGEWVNLFTGKDEDLLGYNHDGIRVNEEKGKVGFDRNRKYHKKLEDGTFSIESSLYDEDGFDAYGFDRKNNGKNEFNSRDFYRVNGKDGVRYVHRKTCTLYDYDGYDIDGFDERGFNREGIHKITGCSYNEAGISFSNGNVYAFPLKRILEGKIEKEKINGILIQWFVLSRIYPDAIKQSRWYKTLIEIKGKISDIQISKLCKEEQISQKIILEEQIEESKRLELEFQKQLEEENRLKKEKKRYENEVLIIIQEPIKNNAAREEK